MRVEHEYRRCGAWIYLAAWDVRRAKIYGRCVPKMCIAAFDSLVEQVMSQEPYRSATRVFWIMDNCSSHRGERCTDRLRKRWPAIIVVHTPCTRVGSIKWRSISPWSSARSSRRTISLRWPHSKTACFASSEHYESVARPFEWKFTRADLAKLLAKLPVARLTLPTAA